MVSGIDWLRWSLPSKRAKTARICSKRRATSRPFFSPASVITVKWVEWISSQGFGSGAAEADIEHMNRPHNVSQSEMAGMRRMGRGEWDALQGNATTVSESSRAPGMRRHLHVPASLLPYEGKVPSRPAGGTRALLRGLSLII